MGIGLFVGVYIQKLKTKSTESVWESKEIEFRKTESSLKEEIKEIQSRKSEIEIALAKEESKSDNLEEKLLEQKQELEKLQEKFTKEFENMANKILDEKSEKFTKSNKENIDNILDPLNKKIKEFEEKVVKSQQENFGLHAALKQQLLDLRSQNLKITQEAENLTKALKGDSKMQGNWGEVILTRILEKSGLTKDREYTLQDSFKDEEGKRYQTDVLIHLPDGKKMIVDSKVSIVHFERYVSDEDEKGYFIDFDGGDDCISALAFFVA